MQRGGGCRWECWPLSFLPGAAVRRLRSFLKATAPARQPCPHGFSLPSSQTCFPHLLMPRSVVRAPFTAGAGVLTIQASFLIPCPHLCKQSYTGYPSVTPSEQSICSLLGPQRATSSDIWTDGHENNPERDCRALGMKRERGQGGIEEEPVPMSIK